MQAVSERINAWVTADAVNMLKAEYALWMGGGEGRRRLTDDGREALAAVGVKAGDNRLLH